MAAHSSTLAWKIPWAAETGGLRSMGSLRVRHDWSDFTFTFHFHPLEKEMATHSSTLAGRIPGSAEPDGLPSMGSHRVGHDWSDLAAAAAGMEPVSPTLQADSLYYTYKKLVRKILEFSIVSIYKIMTIELSLYCLTSLQLLSGCTEHKQNLKNYENEEYFISFDYLKTSLRCWMTEKNIREISKVSSP